MPEADDALNVLGTKLETCSLNPVTGFFRTGCCETGLQDAGSHVVCAIMTDDFLSFSAARGNDLMTPRPEFAFLGLKAGDQWCLCVTRWQEALEAGVAPRVYLRATHQKALETVTLKDLKAHSLDADRMN